MAHHRKLVLLLTAALAVRILIALASPGARYDIDSYHIQADAVLAGQNIYTTTYRYPYPPLWMYVPAAASRLAEWSSIDFSFLVRLPAIIADLVIGYLLFKWPSADANISTMRAAVYLFNPVSLLISAAHGQFDSIVISCVLLAAWFLLDRKEIRSAISLGVAIALKGFPILLLPVFLITLFSWDRVVRYAGLAVSVIGLIALPYLYESGQRILNIIFAYNSTADHGYAYVVNQLPLGIAFNHEQLLTGVRGVARWLQSGVVALTVFIGHIRKWPLERRIAIVLLGIYAVSPGLASQQMVWVLPFLILIGGRSFWVYTTISTLALVLFYGQYFPNVILLENNWTTGWIVPLRLGVETTWWVCVVFIAFDMLRNRPTVSK
jgi:hypothetical protein